MFFSGTRLPQENDKWGKIVQAGSWEAVMDAQGRRPVKWRMKKDGFCGPRGSCRYVVYT